MKCRVTVDIPDGEGWVEALGLGRDGPVQQFHTANVLRRIQKYMPYRTGATIKLTIAQTDTHVPEIVTDNPAGAVPVLRHEQKRKVAELYPYQKPAGRAALG